MKYSLHIGLNRVDPFVYGGWNGQLYGCHNDANAMADIALKNGYQTSILLSEEATMKKVLDGIYTYALLANAGDTFLLTYSGHGGQLPDQGTDEKDGLDETWVLYDGMLLDDRLLQSLAAFRAGVRIVVLSDSCHSGTVVKTKYMGLYADKSILHSLKAAPDKVCREYAKTFTPSTTNWRPRIRASVILISGCADNQFSYDGDVNGKFTEKVLEVYDNGKYPGGYRAFRKAIVKRMPIEQTPQFMTMGKKDKFFEDTTAVFTGR